jgi:hypothetical protein
MSEHFRIVCCSFANRQLQAIDPLRLANRYTPTISLNFRPIGAHEHGVAPSPLRPRHFKILLRWRTGRALHVAAFAGVWLTQVARPLTPASA